MTQSALDIPDGDPTSIFEIFRGSYGTELLTAAGLTPTEVVSTLIHCGVMPGVK